MTIRDNKLYGVLCATSCGWQGETIHDLLAHRREAHGPFKTNLLIAMPEAEHEMYARTWRTSISTRAAWAAKRRVTP